MKAIEEYVRSIPDFPRIGNYIQRCNKHSSGCGGVTSGNRSDAGKTKRRRV